MPHFDIAAGVVGARTGTSGEFNLSNTCKASFLKINLEQSRYQDL